MNERRREALRQELLELHFGCHADPDGLQARIDADPALQALAAEVRQEALLLEAAASEPTRELDLPEPKAWPPRKEVVIWHKRPLVRITAALVLGILLVPTGLWLVNRVRHDLLERSATRLELAGPSGFPDGAPARYTIRTTDFQGEDREREVVWRLFDEHGEKKSSGSLMSTGTATLELPAQLGGPRRLEVALADSPETAAASLYLSPAAESPLIHLTTDKPVYRPGEQVYMRGVLLDRLSLEPRENSYRLRIVGPRDRVEQDTIVQSREGVLAPRFLLPPEAPGGEYAVELRDRDNQFAVERRTFLVQRFEAPRFEKRIDLDRKTYAPGESGSAEVTIARLGQGPAAGAQLDASVIVDGEVIWKNQSTLDEAGRAIFSFQVPGEVARGEGRFVARVSDGSVVESDIEPFVIPLDRLEVSFFPEGGSLVAGTENRVYAEVTDPLGRAVEAEGRIVDSKNRTVHSFKTEHQGRARFTYSPEVGERYQLRFESPSAEASDLPKAEASGVTLRAKADSFAPGAPVAAEVHTTDPGLWIAGVFCRGTLVGQTTFHGAGNHDLEIDLGPEATGVLRLTVFRRDLLPVAERLVRRESDRGIAIRVEPEYETIVPGEHQKLTVHTTDESGEPVSAVLGVSVIDSATRDILDEPRIGLLEQALFFADVEELEDIEDFVTTDADSARHIDLVLGTRGWRRFGWLKPDELIAEHGDAARRVLIREGRPGLPRVAQKMLLSGGAQPELLGELDRRARDFGGAAAAIWLVVIIALFIGLVVARFTPPEKRFARGVAAVTLAGVLASLGLTLWSSQGSDFMASGEDAAAEMAVAEASIGNQNYWTGPGDDRSLNLAGIELETELTRKLQSLGYPGAGGRRPEDGFALGREETVAEIDDDLIEEEELGTDFDEVLEEPAQEVAELDDLDVEAEEEPEADPAAAEWKPRAGGAGPPVPIPGRAANMRQLGYSDGSRADFESYARIYAHKRRSEVGRGDFQETVYWNALLKTDDSGKATVEFDVSDRVTTWEVGIDAHGAGRIGQALATFESKLPFHLEAKLPVEVAAGDRLQIPVAFSASDPELLSAALGFRVTDPLETDAPSSQEVPIRDGRGRVLLPIDVGELPGPARLTLNGSSGRFADRVERDLRVVPRGFPHHDSRSGLLKESVALDVRAPDSYHRGTLRARVKLYPSPLDDLGEGLEGMIQEPHGCFEQTSSTHYPNVLALQLIEATGIEAPAAAQRARGTIDRGIERLLGFECKSGGFEWFGHDPGHELLTAYGLLEFRDTQQVDGYIPAEIVERTRQWLLDHRTGNGDYRVRRDGLHSWFADPNLVNAYLTYSLVGTGVDAKALTAELDRLEQRLPVTEDAYEIGWIARALQAAERQSAADARRRLKSAQQSDGSVPGLGSSIVGSKGEGLIIETTALAALAWSDDEAFAGPRRQAVEYLLTKRHGNGSFGSTQATVLALKALVKQAELERRITQEGDFTVYLNDQLVDGRHVRAGHRGVIELDALGDRLEPGINRVRLELSGGNELPWSFELNYSSDQPADAVDVPVRISTEVAAAEVREGESVPVKVRVENVSGDDLPMTMAIVGLPASLTVSPKILDDLRDAGRFDFWETSGRDVVLYFRGMKKDQVREITLDTEASFPGETTGAASRTYPYYSPEQTSWAAPLHVRVNAE